MVKEIDLAVVIPTLNEEKFIGTLLDSIFYQTVWPKEIVVVDATSSDQTIVEIEKRAKMLPQLKYFQVPKSTISNQRNFGSKKTKASNILFLDADMKLQERDTLQKYFDEARIKNPDIAVSTVLPLSTSWKDRVVFFNMNLLIKTSKPIWPWAPGMNIYVKRSSFEKVKGFDGEVRVGEDMDLVQRMVKAGLKFEFLDSPKLYTSVRRFIKEGRRRFIWKLIKNFISVQRKGFKEAQIEYEFGDWDKTPKNEKLLNKLFHEMEKNRFTQALLKILKK